MKRVLLLWIALLLPMQPILAQEAARQAQFLAQEKALQAQSAVQPPEIKNKWLASISNNFTRLPSWFSFDKFNKVSSATWQKINQLFGGFKMQTFIGAARAINQCSQVNRYMYLSKRLQVINELLAQIVPKAQDEYQFVSRVKFGTLFMENIDWIRYYGWSSFVGELNPTDMYIRLTSLKNRFEKVVDELKRSDAVKKYLDTGENICEKAPGPFKFVLMAYRDIIIIILLIIAIIWGISLSPEIYNYYKNKLFRKQPSQQKVQRRAPDEIQRAERARQDIIQGFFAREAGIRERLRNNVEISDAEALFIGESDEKTERRLLLNLNAMQSGRDDISAIGIIAATPYIHDEKRMEYIGRLRDANILETELDRQLVNLLEFKLNPVPRVKSARKGGWSDND